MLLAGLVPVEDETISFTGALNRVLAVDLIAPYDLPIFTNSAMDGFAIRSEDVISASPDYPVTLAVVGDIPAGAHSSIQIKAGQAARIMTGAALPPGADSVIPVEQVHLGRPNLEELPGEIHIAASIQPGHYVRSRGQDAQMGQVVLSRGRRITPAAVGVLAMYGLLNVRVFRSPRVALLSSGNELVQPDEALSPGKIRDANTFMLRSLVTNDFGEVVYTGLARDTRSSVQEQFDLAAEKKPDIILTSAGVSVGAFDFIRAVVQEKGKISFWRVNMRPGKPVAFGDYRGIPIIGLPGNPVSAFVGYQVFVLPALMKLSGMATQNRLTHQVIISRPIESDGRESYLRAVLKVEDGKTIAIPVENQGSGNLLSIIQSNALLIVPSGVKSLPARSTLEAWLLEENWS